MHWFINKLPSTSRNWHFKKGSKHTWGYIQYKVCIYQSLTFYNTRVNIFFFAQQYLQWLYTNQQNKNMYQEPTLVRDYFISQIFCTLFPWFVASFFHPWWNLIFFSLILQLIAPLVASVPLVLSDLSEPKDKQCAVLKLKLKMKKFHTNIQIVWYCK